MTTKPTARRTRPDFWTIPSEVQAPPAPPPRAPSCEGQAPRAPQLRALARDIERWARELGFRGVGIADTELANYAPAFRDWLEQRLYGDMGYLARNVDKRLEPDRLHPGTIRVISARMDYLGTPPPAATDLPANDGSAYIARYALGRDYHKTVRRRLARLAARIDSSSGGRFRAFTDSAPVLEKPLGEKSGLGWIGKNTLLLNEQAGSWFFLGEIYTDLPLPVTPTRPQPGCGTCRACMTVCPTDAITGPRKLDARRCISYLTIEHKGSIPVEFREAVGNRVFGCDDCQIVCPWNRFARRSPEAEFAPRRGLDQATLVDLLGWDEYAFQARTEGMALRRINYEQWVRNLAVAAGNAPPDPAIVAALKRRRESAGAMVREHIDWALARQERPV
ncbi:MAG: tRNA epoxyqueuosine(34) reductase QueG [Gammaproteobacteria bacterium]|nr:tRNA epoxyqueuosine(34) reductase QueG [Gammaproteobacteria bacterium]